MYENFAIENTSGKKLRRADGAVMQCKFETLEKDQDK